MSGKFSTIGIQGGSHLSGPPVAVHDVLVGQDVLLKLDGETRLLAFDNQMRLDLAQERQGYVAGCVPIEAGPINGVLPVGVVVDAEASSKLGVKSFDKRSFRHRNTRNQLIAYACMALLGFWSAIGSNPSFAVEQASNVLNIEHVYSLSDKREAAKVGGTPTLCQEAGNTEPSMIEYVNTNAYSYSTQGVCNERMAAPKGKVRSGLHGNMESPAEMTGPGLWPRNINDTRYSGADILDISPQTVITAAEFNPKQAAVSVNITGLEELQNSGPNAIIDLLEARIRNAEGAMSNGLSVDMYSNGTSSSGKQIGGLQLLVATTNTNTVGGISGSTWSFWRNLAYSASGQGTAAQSSSTIQADWNSIYGQTTRGNDKVDLILADTKTYNFYMASLQPLQRFTQSTDADAGFTSLKYQGADVVLDGGISGNVPTNTSFFLNTKYLFWRPHAQRNIVPLDDGRFSVNQDAMIKLIVWAGNMTVSSRRQQAVYYP